jgi:hypothetical protein
MSGDLLDSRLRLNVGVYHFANYLVQIPAHWVAGEFEIVSNEMKASPDCRAAGRFLR